MLSLLNNTFTYTKCGEYSDFISDDVVKLTHTGSNIIDDDNYYRFITDIYAYREICDNIQIINAVNVICPICKYKIMDDECMGIHNMVYFHIYCVKILNNMFNNSPIVTTTLVSRLGTERLPIYGIINSALVVRNGAYIELWGISLNIPGIKSIYLSLLDIKFQQLEIQRNINSYCSRCGKNIMQITYDHATKYYCDYCAELLIKFKYKIFYGYLALSQLVVRDIQIKITRLICDIYDSVNINNIYM